jgi:hypothetical protein
MRRKKEDYFVIVLGVILIVIVSVIAIIAANYSESSNENTENPTTITPNPSRGTTNTTRNNPAVNFSQTRPPLLYDEEADLKLMDLVENRRPISNADALAKSKILTLLPQGRVSGVVHQTRNIRIEYVQSADIFQVEILTTEINTAKDEANVWFREQGLSQNAICTLPISFYVSYDVANQLRSTNVVVSALGNGC